jgi:hypothetical protein
MKWGWGVLGGRGRGCFFKTFHSRWPMSVRQTASRSSGRVSALAAPALQPTYQMLGRFCRWIKMQNALSNGRTQWECGWEERKREREGNNWANGERGREPNQSR